MGSSEEAKRLLRREQRIKEAIDFWKFSSEIVAHVSEIIKGAAADDTKWEEARTFLMGLSGDGDNEEKQRTWDKVRERWAEIFDVAGECAGSRLR